VDQQLTQADHSASLISDSRSNLRVLVSSARCKLSSRCNLSRCNKLPVSAACSAKPSNLNLNSKLSDQEAVYSVNSLLLNSMANLPRLVCSGPSSPKLEVVCSNLRAYRKDNLSLQLGVPQLLNMEEELQPSQEADKQAKSSNQWTIQLMISTWIRAVLVSKTLSRPSNGTTCSPESWLLLLGRER
jgi:hypothetical protein